MSAASLTSGDEIARRFLARLRPGPGGWIAAGLTVVLVAVAAGASALLLLLTGGSPSASAAAIWTGSLADATGWTTTLLNTAPLLLVAVGACICASAGTFNIGQEGQVLIGGLAGAWVGLRLAVPGPMLVVVVLIAAAVGGGAWAALSALMLRFRGVNVPVSTLLMTFLAIQLVTFAVSTPWLQESAQGSSGIADAASNPLPANARLAGFGQYPSVQLNAGLFIALVAAVGVALVLTRSRWGFRVRMLGLNPLTAQHTGVRVAALGGFTLALSGAFAGLAGGLLLVSPVGTNRLQAGLSDNFGWDGLLVALVARNRPLVAIPVSLVFAVLRAGGDFLSATGVPYYLVDVVKALLVLAFVAPPVLVDLFRRRRGATPQAAPAVSVVPTKVKASV
ncbi:ABC transporter permease [Streptomyces sp. PSKA54]|uniref:ABC transporter permease n=1 Tax=Streptomyces himalayensis subsp. aureolus TaxID=2758039 RepID=A0A7W2HGL1_9ACTN|nr:ABC transporter permease [Streptomyces himalayensis]MBA4863100.1 ABC transporter permease [Streptomyces himalayensis subsp. aureolus]